MENNWFECVFPIVKSAREVKHRQKTTKKIIRITFSYLKRVLDVVSPPSPSSRNPSVHCTPETHKSQRVIKAIKALQLRWTIDETHLKHTSESPTLFQSDNYIPDILPLNVNRNTNRRGIPHQKATSVRIQISREIQKLTTF